MGKIYDILVIILLLIHYSPPIFKSSFDSTMSVIIIAISVLAVSFLGVGIISALKACLAGYAKHIYNPRLVFLLGLGEIRHSDRSAILYLFHIKTQFLVSARCF